MNTMPFRPLNTYVCTFFLPPAKGPAETNAASLVYLESWELGLQQVVSACVSFLIRRL